MAMTSAALDGHHLYNVGLPTPARLAISSMLTSRTDFSRSKARTASMIAACAAALSAGGRPRRAGLRGSVIEPYLAKRVGKAIDARAACINNTTRSVNYIAYRQTRPNFSITPMTNPPITRHPLDPADVAPRAAIRALLEPQRDKWPDWPERRASFNDLIAAISAVPNVEYEASSVGGVPGFWCRPPNARSGAALLYFHGGAYVVGSPRAHRGFVSHLASRTRTATFIPQYRLAPEHRFPAAVEDARACYRALRNDLPGPIAIAGASA